MLLGLWFSQRWLIAGLLHFGTSQFMECEIEGIVESSDHYFTKRSVDDSQHEFLILRNLVVEIRNSTITYSQVSFMVIGGVKVEWSKSHQSWPHLTEITMLELLAWWYREANKLLWCLPHSKDQLMMPRPGRGRLGSAQLSYVNVRQRHQQNLYWW